jgi:hypothetical protein
MENRDRDKLSRNSTGSTEAGDLNRDKSLGDANRKDDSSAEFGQNIGRSENLNEPNRRGEGVGDEGMKGGTGRSGSIERESNSDVERERPSSIERDRSEPQH